MSTKEKKKKLTLKNFTGNALPVKFFRVNFFFFSFVLIFIHLGIH